MKKALLLALDNYYDTNDDDSGLELVAPANDVVLLRQTLLQIGYTDEGITVSRSSDGPALTTNVLRRSIEKFFGDAEPEDELLLYVSGHGVDQDGHRLIVPVDYYSDAPLPAESLVGDERIYVAARASSATSIIVFVDACRAGVQLQMAAVPVDKAPPARRRARHIHPTAPSIAIVYSSRPGTVSWASGGSRGTSYFTAALCHVLAGGENVSTLDEVVEATNRYLPEILPDDTDQECFVDERHWVPGRAGEPGALIIKESVAARLKQQIECSDWYHMLRASPLWQAVEHCDGLALQVSAITARAEDLARRARETCPGGRWQDDRALARFLDSLSLLIPTEQDPGEAALCLVVPFVYEAALAGLANRFAAEGELALADDRSDPVSTAGRTWRQTLALGDDWARRRDHMLRIGATQGATDLLEWQLWSFAHRAGEVWTYSEPKTAQIGWLNDVFDQLFALAPVPEVANDQHIRDLLSPWRLLRLARLSFGEPEDIEGEASRSHDGLDRHLRFGSGRALWNVDEVDVAHLLRLASEMALDARRLPPIVAEHLGLDGFSLEVLHEELARACWQEAEDRRLLALTTQYPVVHAALSEVVQQLERHRGRILRSGAGGDRLGRVLALAFDESRLLPLTEGGRPIFDRQHLRFTLDQGRMISMLMGEELYGDPKLALRELYQNALDACRYRRAREQMVAHMARTGNEYEPRITFISEMISGRPAIICDDNGVGMEERHVRGLFARAGRRFTDSHEYHLDQARWQEADIRFWPNSRFGIGVLSYFMLAEEIELETRRLLPHGSCADEGLLVHVTGSGSLFRLVTDRNVRRMGGTRVTLFPKDTNLDPDDLLDSMLEWLWIPGVDVEMIRRNGKTQMLRAYEPTPVCRTTCGELVPILGSGASDGSVRLFWILKKGRSTRTDSVLLDGIRTKSPSAPSALLVDLKEGLAGDVSVDRNNVHFLPAVNKWVATILKEDGGVALIANERRSEDLAELAYSQPRALCDFDTELSARRVIAEGATINYPTGALPVDSGLGLCMLDEKVRHLLKTGMLAESLWIQRIVQVRLCELAGVGAVLPPSLHTLAEFTRTAFDIDRLPLTSELIVAMAIRAEGFDRDGLGMRELVTVGAALTMTPSEVAIGAQPLIRLGLCVADPSPLRDLDSFSPDTLRLLSIHLNGSDPFLDYADGWQVLRLSQLMRVAPAELVREVNVLEKLGLFNGDATGLASLTESLDDSLSMLLTPYSSAGEIPLDRLLMFCIDQSIRTLRQLECFIPLERLGLLPVSLTELKSLLDVLGELPDQGRSYLTLFSDKNSDDLTVTLRDVIISALDSTALPATLVDHAKTLRKLKLAVGDFDLLLGVNLNSRILKTLFSRDADGLRPFMPAVPIRTVIAAMVGGIAPRSEIASLVNSLAAMGLVSFDPEILKELPDSGPLLIAAQSLLWNDDQAQARLEPVEIYRDALRYSVDPCALARCLSPLGAPQISESREWHPLTKVLFDASLEQETPVTATELAILVSARDLDLATLSHCISDLEFCGIDVAEAKAFIAAMETPTS